MVRIDLLADHPEALATLAAPIWAHWRHVLPEDTCIAHREAKLRAHMQRRQLPLALVAHEDGIFLGTAAIRSHDLDDRPDLTPWLGGVFVLPEHRGKGIASALCLAIKLRAHAMGLSQLYLFTPDQQGLYERLGWRHVSLAQWRGLAGCIMVAETAAR